MRTNGIEALGQQIERLAKESKDYETSWRSACELAKGSTNAQWKAEQERNDAIRERDAAHSDLRMLRASKKEAVERLEKENEKLIEEIHAINAKPAPSQPKEGTWAWACEMAFKNPGKIYGRSWVGAEPGYTMVIEAGKMTTKIGSRFLVVTNDVHATDWREVTP